MRHRWTYCWIVLAAALTGCGRMDPASTGEAILFSASPAKVSTAPTKVIAGLPDDESYLVKNGNKVAVYGAWTSPEGVSSDVFRGLELSCEKPGAEAANWVYSPLKYWRTNGTYAFSAVYPPDVSVQFGTSGGKLVASYSMLANDFDLMAASASRSPATQGIDPVNLQFRHACAAVRFLFCKGGDNTDYYVDSFQLQNLHAVGILVSENGEEFSWQPAEFRTAVIYDWKAASLDERLSVPREEDGYVSQGWHFAIPQSLSGNDGLTPTVQFSVNVGASTTPVYTHIALPLTYADSGDPVEWKAGNVYTYTIRIQPSWAYLSVEVKPWDSYYLAVDNIVF